MEPKTLKKWDQDYIWHPFTQMADWLQREPLVIDRADGSYLIDVEGRRYLDGVSSLWVNVHGHRHPALDEALRAQIAKVSHSTLLGLANTPSIELAKKLMEIAPSGLTKVFYSDNGSTAVEIALKMTFQYWQQVRPGSKKTRFMALDQAYHGDTIGSVSVGGMDLFHQIYKPLLFEAIRIPCPHVTARAKKISLAEAGESCLREAQRIMMERAAETAALIIEPRMQGAAGMLRMPDGFLRGLRALSQKHEILLICDEVATGFGRTGKMFACEQEGVSPDLLCLAKGITGGYLPLAATLTTQRLYEGFMGEVKALKTFFHGHTYTGNPLACAAALANLKLFEREGFWEELNGKIGFFAELLSSLCSLSHVGEIRQEGMMVGIELVKDKSTLEPFSYEEQIGHRICYAARPKGLLIRPLGNVLVLMPPLSMTKGELQDLTKIVKETIEEVLCG